MSTTAIGLPKPTTLPDSQPTVTVPTEPAPGPPTKPPTEPTEPKEPTEPTEPTKPTKEPPTEEPTEPPVPVPVPPVTSDDSTADSTTKDSPPPAPPAPPAPSKPSATSIAEEPTETSAPSATLPADPDVTTAATSVKSNSKPAQPVFTSVVTTKGETGELTTIVVTSTGAAPTKTISVTGTSASDAGSALQNASAGSDDSGGLSPAGTIAVAVVVPVVSVTLIIIGLIIWWRKREANKRSEQQRKSEIEDYGYNPNNDPTLPTVGGSAFGDGSEMREDNSGYRGWGTTSASRKLSTNMSSGPGMGNTVSENGSNRGYHHAGSPSDGTTQLSDGYGGRISGDSIGALGMGPPASHNRPNRDIARGPSNASSANSGGHRSEESEDGTLIDGPGGPGYHGDSRYYSYGQPQQGPYGDGPGQPVIRDVTARRNTRIESPSVIPQQGNSGISQNF